MMDAEKFKHDVSRYERPTLRYRCGRGADWGKPCEFGPSVSGDCGGTAECRPAKVGDRWECRRSPLFGGPCDQGPDSGGTCSHKHPPCRPRRTIRSLRGFLSLAAFAAVVAVIAVFTTFDGGGSAGDGIKSAGPLTGGHANFTADTGCVSCHEAHGEDAGDWMLAAFHEDDMTGQCLDCHTFGGDARLGHNASFSKDAPIAQTQCVMCHTEHKGEDFNIKVMSDSQCNACHETSVSSFAENHPSFGENFPHDRRTSIKFNHVSHISTHFVDQRFSELAPEDCTVCHNVDTAAQAVEPASFDETCSVCHLNAVTERDLVLLRLPEFAENLIDHDMVSESCGPTLEQWEAMSEKMEVMAEAMDSGEAMEADEEDEEEFEAISLEEATPVSAYLLGIVPDDMDEYGGPMQEFIARLIEEGPAPLAEAIDERAGRPISSRLLSGLNPELVKRVACAWASNLEYEPPMDPEFGGWYGDLLELKYRPVSHMDMVALGWTQFATESLAEDDEDIVDYAEAMRDTVLSPKGGVGACTKCHAISDDGDGGQEIEWRYRPTEARPYTRYSHGTHLTLLDPEGVNLMDPDGGCRTCHKLDQDAQYAESFNQSDPHHFQSNFQPIDQEACAQCHNEGQVRQDCQLCHVYHFEPGFDLKTATNKE